MDFGEEDNSDYFDVEELVMELFQGENVGNIGEENIEWFMQNFPAHYYDGGVDESVGTWVGEEDNFGVDELEIELLLAQSVGNPVTRNVVHNLPLVHLQEEDVCGVCIEDMLVHEIVKQLPCCHHFHGQCIDPWLEMHNTCPICRYELPVPMVDN